MNRTLQDYIIRSDEILKNISDDKISKKTLLDNEFTDMISFMENALDKIRSNYKKFKQINEKNDTNNNIQNNLITKEVNVLKLTDFIDKKDELYTKINWIPEINQYYLKINNLVLRGNIGNIYDKKILQNDKINAHQVVICKYGNFCQDILRERYCKFYHDPLELYDLKVCGKISEGYYQKHIQKYVRNFSNTSWLYSSNKPPFVSENIRNIGSKSTLEHDLSIIKHSSYKYKRYIIENMKHQVIHDILILLILSDHDLT